MASSWPEVLACPTSRHIPRSVPATISSSSDAFTPSITGTSGMFSMARRTPYSVWARSRRRMVSLDARIDFSRMSVMARLTIPGWTVMHWAPNSTAASISDMNSMHDASLMRSLRAAALVSAIAE